ncbi:HlyD family efflux transporter periplasmic adaptor subunit [Spirulina subsalsa FACHB-351]|uniref:HlyD family efflux transporter periplasmic adaptor subunit n=1 Tax=Spirulina subsalsa FACHB-351 TaxID=234711 RepID=A0ABT3L9R1_9CYAN|nr:HlyD family efflux transporter periplasmic adaptor subunit [Spirulina subsalsa]MCW6038224.1 HlyD family efflux transporter periplasmic adaptor subunit [Spirulina subsalsa FACHB-351]
MNGNNGNRNGQRIRYPMQAVSTKNSSSSALQTRPKNGSTLAPVSRGKKSSHLDRRFDQSVILRQPRTWSRAIVWTIISVVSFGVGWACLAEIEQVVQATGQLKPQDTVKEVQAPVDGVVETLYVREGDFVRPGDLLMRFESNTSRADLEAVKGIKEALEKENQLYRQLIESGSREELLKAIAALNLPASMVGLTRNRDELLAENRYYQAQLTGNLGQLSPQERDRLQVSLIEARSRENAARLEVQQIQRQLQQNQVQIADARNNLTTQQNLLQDIRQRAQSSLQQAQESLALEERLLAEMAPLGQEGAIARFQIEQQRQTVNDRRSEVLRIQNDSRIEQREQLQRIETNRAEISRLTEENRRLQLAIEQGGQQFTNTAAITQKEIQEAIARNNQRIADIDSQLTQAVLNVVVNNEKRIKELESQLVRSAQALEYKELRATVAGTVFDLKAYRGFVVNPTQTLLSIVPQDNLVGEVFITNRDIGFVQPGMNTDVRIDTFPFSEFGDIKGTVKSLGSDALAPDEVYNFYRFPATIALEDQVLRSQGRDIPLQSGMSISVNVKVRENRKVISLFIELFTNQIESLKQVR